MENKILDDVKKTLGLDPDYSVYDCDLTIYINSSLSLLYQVGSIQTLQTLPNIVYWDDIDAIPCNKELIKLYVCIKSRLLFDPPAHSFTIQSIENELNELLWRMEVCDHV